MEFKFKPICNKVQEHNVSQIANVIEQPEIKDKKVKTPAKKVVYISKNGSKAIFDSIHLCAKIFNVDICTIKYKIEHPIPKKKATLKGDDWLKGGCLEYYND